MTAAESGGLDPELKAALIDLGEQLPAIWGGGRLTRPQKKALLRCLIEKVVIHRARRDQVQTRIVWRGGAVSELQIPLTVSSFAVLPCAQELEAQTLELERAGCPDREIAERLTMAGLRTPRHDHVRESTVRRLRLKHRLLVDRHHPHRLRPAAYVSVSELAQRLGMPPHWIYYQIQSGRIEISRGPGSGLYLFPDQPETVEQLKQLKAGEVEIVRL